MEWGVTLPHLGHIATRDALIEFSTAVDDLGFNSGWASDHVCWPAEFVSQYPYSDDGSFPAPPKTGWLDPIGTLQFVAAVTQNLRLGFSVLILPYRPPVETAKRLATIDVLSGGRLILGVGVGWMREEAEVLGMPWDRRGKRSDEQLEVFRTLFSEDDPSYDGEFYSFPVVGFEPKPVQNPVPVWVGGNSVAAYRRVAQFGHGFHAAFETLDDIASGWAAVGEACDAAEPRPQRDHPLAALLPGPGCSHEASRVSRRQHRADDRKRRPSGRDWRNTPGARPGRSRRRRGPSRRSARIHVRRRPALRLTLGRTRANAAEAGVAVRRRRAEVSRGLRSARAERRGQSAAAARPPDADAGGVDS